MATLYVENVPDELYKGLRRRAKQNQKSIAAEVMTLLKLHVPTEEVLRKRRHAVKELARLHETTVAVEVKVAMEQRLERLGYEVTP